MTNEWDALALNTLAAHIGVPVTDIANVEWFGHCGCYSTYTAEPDEVGVAVTFTNGQGKEIAWGLPDVLIAMDGYRKAAEEAADECESTYGGRRGEDD